MASKVVGTGKTVMLSLQTSGIDNGESAEFEIFKVDGDESLGTISGNVSEGKVEAEWTAEGPGEDDEEQFWDLYYKVKVKDLEAKCMGLVVFTDWVEITTVDENDSSLPDASFRLTVKDEQRERNTGQSGVRKCEHLPGPGDVEIEFIPPFELIEWVDEDGPKRKAKVREVRPAKLVYPPAGEHTQWVNLEPSDDAPENGSTLKVKVTLIDARAGLKGYARVEWGEENSKRNDPKPELVGGVQEDWCEQGGIEFELPKDDGEPDCEATFDIELGLAGCDTCTLYVGGTKECADEKVVIRNMRKLYYQVTRHAEMVLPGFEPTFDVLDQVGINYEEYNEVEVSEGDPPDGSIVDGITVGVSGPALVIGDHNFDFFKGKLQDDKSPLGAHLIFCHAQYDGGESGSWHEQTLEFEVKQQKKTVNITDDELYDIFPMAIQDGQSCILSGSTWESTAPSGHPDEGKSGDLTGDDFDFHFVSTPDRLQVTLPSEGAEIVGDGEGEGDDVKHPVKVTINIRVARGPFLGMSKEQHQLIVQSPSDLRTNQTLVHELGHAMKQCLKEIPPGLSESDHGRKYEGKEHEGHHCGHGMSDGDFALDDFRDAAPGTCVMYGEGIGETDPDPEALLFCERCTPFVRAQDLLSLGGDGKLIWHRTADDIADEEAGPQGRVVAVEAVTAAGNPVVGVEATLLMDDGQELKEKTDEEGKIEFKDVPEEQAAELVYQDEEDLIARSVAADIKAALGAEDLPAILGILQSAVDFEAVKTVYQESYGDDPGPLIKGKFTQEETIVEYLLCRSGLFDTGMTIVKDEFGQAE